MTSPAPCAEPPTPSSRGLRPRGRAAGRAVPVLLAAALALLAAQAPASAVGGNGPGDGAGGGGTTSTGSTSAASTSTGSTSTASTSPGPAEDGDRSAPVVRRVRTCTLYANDAGFGAWCGSGTGLRGRTWRARLAGKPFVKCRQDPVPDGVQTPQDPDRPGRWRLETCMRDVDLDTVDGGPDARTEIRIVWVTPDRDLGAVPPWMTWLWDTFTSAYPVPVLSVGPTARPRVNVPATFWLEGASAQTQTREVFDGRGAISMVARLVRLRVDPGTLPGLGGLGGAPGPLDCAAGTVPYDRTRSPFEQPSTCTITFRRSSAALPQHAYPVRADAFWQVGWVDAAGTFRQLGVFSVASIQLLPVQEVESVVRVTGG